MVKLIIRNKKGGDIKMAIIKWQCIKCGKIVTSGVVSGGRAIVPGGRTAGNCPETATGNHIWKKMG